MLPNIDGGGDAMNTGCRSLSRQSRRSKRYKPGGYFLAKYNCEWYVIQVLKDKEDVQPGYTHCTTWRKI
jgi:hypothetical protein